jgi:carbamoyltransferase
MADASNASVVRTINRAIKSRDFWMPFACSVIDHAQDRYLDNPKGFKAPYMILTFNSKNTHEIIAGCHPEDGSVRPQVVEESWNHDYHRLISAFERRTGRGAILNTSFNLHGEPIVSAPSEALDVMARSGLTRLILGPYLITKTPQTQAPVKAGERS